ncbi:hypothetical protein NMG60_11002457 [Bertholletia excelsa]
MARTVGECAPRKLLEAVEDGNRPLSCPQELHVLAVDDSLVDCKVIERLLKISHCRGLVNLERNICGDHVIRECPSSNR